MTGGCFGQNKCEMIVFNSQRSKQGGQQIPDFQRDDALLRGLVDSLLGGSPGRLDILQGNLKRTGAGHSYVLKDKPTVRKTDVAEQRAESFDRNSVEKREFKAFGRRGRQLKRTTGMT